VTDLESRFCGECGSPISAESPAPEDVQKAPAAEKTGCAELSAKNALTSAFQTAIAWAIGWLPIGILFSQFYDAKRALSPEFYANYPRTWDSTLLGMTTIYTLGALVGGFLAGLIMYRILGQKGLKPGGIGVLTAVAWFVLWGVSMWGMTLPVGLMDDGTLLIVIPILALVFGALVARITTGILSKKSADAFTPKQRKAVATVWALCAVLSIVVALAAAEI